MIRPARAADAATVQAIYAPRVTDSVVTFETEVPCVAEMRRRMLDRLPHYPWLVHESDGRVDAYAYAGRYRERAAYDWVVETSVYVAPHALRRGIARRLYTALLDVLALQGFTQAMGVITLPGNTSVALHEVLGFTPAGVWRAAGYKLGHWHDVGVWQRALAEPSDPPLPPRPFAQLVGTGELQRLLAGHDAV